MPFAATWMQLEIISEVSHSKNIFLSTSWEATISLGGEDAFVN